VKELWKIAVIKKLKAEPNGRSRLPAAAEKLNVP